MDIARGPVVQDDAFPAAATQEDSAQAIAADAVHTADLAMEVPLDFGFDNSDGHDMVDDEFQDCHQGHDAFEEGTIVEHGDYDFVMVDDAIPELLPEPPLGADGGFESTHEAHPSAHPSALASSSTSTGVAARSPLDAGDAAAAVAIRVGAKRVRLSSKTSPARAAELGYPQPRTEGQSDDDEGLVTQGAAAAARARIRVLKATHRQRVKEARSRAWEAYARQPDFVFFGSDSPAGSSGDVIRDPAAPAPVVPGCWDAHPSHDVAAPSPTLLFCRHCGAWSAGHRVRGLAKQCKGAVGHRGNLRLLTLGIAPVRGARVPAELKRAGSRGTRGGKATKGARGRRRAF